MAPVAFSVLASAGPDSPAKEPTLPFGTEGGPAVENSAWTSEDPAREGDPADEDDAIGADDAGHEDRDRGLADRTRRRLRDAKGVGGAKLRRIQAQVVDDHLWLARSIANRYRNRGEEPDDLFQVACVGLVEAVHRFDPEQGDFIAFAVPTISGLVKRHFRDHGWLVRPPRRTQELVAGMRRQWADLAQELGEQPSDGQLAERLGENATAVSEARCASQGYSPLSLDLLVEGNPGLGAAGSDGGGRDRVEARLVIQRAVRKLDDEERRLVVMRFFEGRSQSDIAAEIGTSQMQISRRLARLMIRLRRIVGDDDEAVLLAS
ncbi:sigma-70 family RNA polymerase sigma factor [Microlunatus ginsengisoli]|uniref:RNA polymerase sigma-B factor n=1 Tax=Microlunatus ginsengisoli TaxID=363863 RepID=A0ABP7AVQ6_9ACTN